METGITNHGIARRPFRGRAWRDLAQFAAEALAAGLLVSLVLALAIFIASTQTPPLEPAPSAGEAKQAPPASDATPARATRLAGQARTGTVGNRNAHEA